jgi:hypothetical protein
MQIVMIYWRFGNGIFRLSLTAGMGSMNKVLYGKLLTGAYAFFIGISLTWVIVSFVVGGYVNYVALMTLAVFGAQAYFRHRLANLALGIIILPASIFASLFFLSWGGKSGFDAFIGIMLSLSVISIGLSIFLVFSYLKLSFNAE